MLEQMSNVEIRLRALLAIRTGEIKYVKDIPSHLQFGGLYPEIQRINMTEEMKYKEDVAITKLKELIDEEWEKKKKPKKIGEYVLSDLTSEEWKGVNIENLPSIIAEMQDTIIKKRMIGELNPKGGEGGGQFGDVSLTNASHIITAVWTDFEKIYGVVEFINVTKGNTAHELIESNNGHFKVRTLVGRSGLEPQLYKIFTWDIISNKI